MDNTLPAHLPLEEAVQHYADYQDGVQLVSIRPPAIPIGGFKSFVLGTCPVRSSTSMWLIDDEGKIWTSRLWCAGGEIAEMANFTKRISFPWPLDAQVQDWTPLTQLLAQRAQVWDDAAFSLVLEQFGDTCVGLHPDMTNNDRRMVRALMIYGFDQEYGASAFSRAVLAGRAKNRRAVINARRRERDRRET